MSSKKTFAGIALTVVALAGCGGSVRKASPAAPIAVPAATTQPLATTVSTPVVTTAAPSTTAAATTTTMSLADLERIVRLRLVENLGDETTQCLAAPNDCDPNAITSEQGPRRSVLAQNLKGFIERSWVSRQPVDDPSYFAIRSVVFDDKKTTATVLSCKWDTAVISQPSAAPDGSDIIVNDLKSTYELRSLMVLERGKWYVSDLQIVEENKGVNQCPARS